MGALVLLSLLPGCRTGARFQPIDTTAPGWSVQQGQALWQRSASAPEIAGDLLLASHADGQTLVQFSKVPLPLLSARSQPGRWQVQYFLEKRVINGRGPVPAKCLWLHVVPALAGLPLQAPLQAEQLAPHRWRIRNVQTGESLLIDLEP